MKSDRIRGRVDHASRPPRAPWRKKLGAVVALCSLVALAGCTSADDDLAQRWDDVNDREYMTGEGSVDSISANERTDAVAFSGVTDAGETLHADDLHGEVVVMNFWYAACPPCQAEAPDLADAHRELGPQGAEFIGVNLHDQEAGSLQFADHFGIAYPSVLDALDDRSVQRAFVDEVPLNAVPSTVILDRDGRVAHRVIGQITDASEFHELVEDTLEEE